MAMSIYRGALKEVGPGVEETSDRINSVNYSYIEFVDGQMLRNVSVVGGLDGKLDFALQEQGNVELHVMQGGKKSDLLVAIKSSDGQFYATDLGGGSLLGYGLVASFTVLGLSLLPLFGIGVLVLWVAWRTWHGLKLVKAAKEHVRSLPDVTLV